MAKTLYKPARFSEREQKWSEIVEFLRSEETLQADVAVISAEHFSHVDPELMAQTVGSYFPRHAVDARYISYLRPHPGSLLSHYAQQTKSGSSVRSLDKMCSFFFKTKSFLFAPRIQAWKAQFGDHLTVRPMIRSQLEVGDVVQDFLTTVAEGKSIQATGEGRSNEALTVQQLAAVREVQSVLREKDIFPKMRVSVGQFLGSQLAQKGAMGGAKLQLSKALAHDIAMRFKEDADQVDKFLGGQPLFAHTLEASADNATDSLQSNTLLAYARNDSAEDIRRLSRILATSLTSQSGKDWKKWYHQSRGQMPKDLPNNEGSKTAVSETLDDLLTAIEVAITPATDQANSTIR
ncbi:MAG: hypothetical protein AAFQ54_06575 [Pseudomonadota bacterium]